MKNLINNSLVLLALSVLAACGSGSATYIPVAAGVNSVAVKNADLPGGTNGTSYKAILGASGGATPYTWLIVPGSGNLPAGLILSNDGIISGAPTALGTYTVVFKVTDSSSPAVAATKPLQINVSTLVFTPGSTGAGLFQDHCAWCHFDLGSTSQQHIGATLAQVKAAISADTGGMGEFGPTGIFPLTDAQLSQIVAAMSAPSSYITPTFTTATLPAATIGVAYSQTLTAKDGTLPYTWSTMGGDSLPAGLTLNAGTGVLSGTPTTAGISNVVFMLEDANPSTMVHKTLAITVNPSAPPPDGAAFYAANCAGCHNPLTSSNKKGRTALQIQNAINANTGGMGSASLKALTSAQVSAISTALQ